jgi:hypothetical protein
VACFRLVKLKAVEKGLLALFTDLARNKQLEEFRDLAAELALAPVKVEHEGFNLFAGYGSVRPYTWFFPKPRVNIVEAVRLYEKIAVNAQVGLDSVGELVSRIYPRNSDTRNLLANFWHRDQWLSPALLFAVCLQHLGPEVEAYGDDRVRMRLGPALIDIQPNGIWSNAQRKRIDPELEDADISMGGFPATTFPAITSDNPVLRALSRMVDGGPLQAAVTLAAHALKEDVISKSFLNKLAKLEGEVVQKARYTRRTVEGASTALNECLQLLESQTTNMIPHLYEAAVPRLMSYKSLQRIIGSVSDIKPGRVIREQTLNNWRIKFQDAFEEVLDAAS